MQRKLIEHLHWAYLRVDCICPAWDMHLAQSIFLLILTILMIFVITQAIVVFANEKHQNYSGQGQTKMQTIVNTHTHTHTHRQTHHAHSP